MDTPFRPRSVANIGNYSKFLCNAANRIQHTYESAIPRSGKLTEKAQKIPLEDMSHKGQQDAIERMKRREIDLRPRGWKRDLKIEELEKWLANGRPVWGTPNPKHPRHDKNEWRKTNKESTLWMDEVEDRDPKHRKRVDIRDMFEVEK